VRDSVYVGDKAIAAMSILLFLLSNVVLFFTARRLFDERIALLACGLILLCDTLWQYSLSGLPQMLLLLIFNATIYCTVRAAQTQIAGAQSRFWLAAIGIGFGLLALTHALTIWMFAGALLFCVLFFRPRGWSTLIVLAAFAIVYAPWLARNYLVCGHPGGAAIYSVLDGVHQTEGAWMRHANLDLAGADPAAFKNKIIANLIGQMNRFFQYLGWSVVAPFFFASLLHAFKRPDTGAIRWMILAMWVGAFFGMATYGINEEQGVAANQLHLIFVPLMTCYGLAFLLVLWNRLEITMRIARIGFQAALFFLCALPLILAFPALAAFKPSIRWPPYVPPYISVINDWMKPEEIIASDMPWAVAWYADRRSIWLPETQRAFTDFNDYGTFGAPVNGLYLTPISGSENKLNDILKGEYKDWAAVILRADLQKFSLKWATLLGLQNECIFFADYDRTKSAPKESAP
jgi:4-amino-4-deoxy-L-arabinose transferase-like glycosyltransferase